jgi:alkaline phosphatase D
MLQRRDLLAAGVAAALPSARLHAQERPLSAIGFVSCLHQGLDQSFVEHVAAQPFDLLLFGGDNVYIDARQGVSLAAAYDKARGLPGHTALRARPHMAAWDDNDYASGDAGAEAPGKDDARRLFLEFWNVPPTDPRRSREGLYVANTFGPAGQRVQVIVLDTRWFRSPVARKRLRQPGEGGYIPNEDPSATMLGAAQWSWLEQRLREPADLRLVLSSVQVLADGHSYERWGNLPRERERLLRLLRDTRANGVVLLSGDRHFAALYQRDAGMAYPLLELTSSGVTHHWASPTDDPADAQQRLLDRNYGAIRIDWAARRLELAAHGRGGQRIAQQLSLDSMKP